MHMREIIDICEAEKLAVVPVLYHGTCQENAERIVREGWTPNSGALGGNAGQTRYLYLSNVPENALWFAQEKGCDIVITVTNVPTSYLRVDPEDGIADTVEDELNNPNGLPGSVVLFRSLGPEHFKF